MKVSILITLLFGYSTISIAQNKIGIDSTYLLGKEKEIYNYREIKVDSRNNKYVIGYYNGSTIISGVTLNSNSQQSYSKSIFLVKLDSLNNPLWVRKIAEGDTLYTCSFAIDKELSYYVAFDYRGTVYHGVDSTIAVGGSDILLIKFDSSGSQIYKKNIGGINGEGISKSSIIVDQSSNFYVSGSYNYTWTNNHPNYKLEFDHDTLESSTMDIFLAKFDSSGNNLWAKSYGGIGQDSPFVLDVSNNSIYMCGVLDATNNNSVGGININYPLNYKSKCFLAKLNANGNAEWVRKFGSTEILQVVSASSVIVSNNKIYFSGHSFSNNQNVFLFDGGPTLTGTNQVDYFIAAYDTNGAFKWNTISRSAGSEYLTQLAADTMGNVVAVGKINYPIYFPSDTLYSYGGDDVMVCSYDSNGAYRWAFHAGGSGADIGSAIAADANGVLYIAGGTTSTECYMGNDTLYPPSGQSTFFYARLDSIPIVAPLSINHTTKELQSITLYPNPSYGEVTLLFSQPTMEQGIITISNTLGQHVYQTQMTSNTRKLTLDVSNLNNGIYYIQYQTDSHQNSYKLVLHK